MRASGTYTLVVPSNSAPVPETEMEDFGWKSPPPQSKLALQVATRPTCDTPPSTKWVWPLLPTNITTVSGSLNQRKATDGPGADVWAAHWRLSRHVAAHQSYPRNSSVDIDAPPASLHHHRTVNNHMPTYAADVLNFGRWQNRHKLHCLAAWNSKLKIGTPVSPALTNVHTNFGFATPFCFQVRTRTRLTDIRANGQDA